jgi:hypothetical protein
MDMKAIAQAMRAEKLKKYGVFYRLLNTLDPEERLEDACLWKAMHDEYGDDICGLESSEGKPPHGVTFGRGMKSEFHNKLRYWEDPGFLENCGRRFTICDFDHLGEEIEKLHNDGLGAFIKSTKDKEYVQPVPLGSDWEKCVGDMAYSFIDGGAPLMVQELLPLKYEHRFIVISRDIVTDSPIAWHLTPLDNLAPYEEYETPSSTQGHRNKECKQAMVGLVKRVIKRMDQPHVCVDTAMGPNGPVVVEFNPMVLGGLGLYACDVRALAKASRKLLA